MLSNLLSNALKFSNRGSVVTIRAGFQAKKQETISSRNVQAPRKGSLLRIKEALVRTGSTIVRNNSTSAKLDSHRVLSDGVDGGGQSVGGGRSVYSKATVKDYVGKQTN